jgi:hypothetical protein
MANRNCRAPEVSFIPKARLTAMGFKPTEKRFFPGAPDLAVEVLSENNTRSEIDGGSLDSEHLLPGFEYPIADLFKDWEWDPAG